MEAETRRRRALLRELVATGRVRSQAQLVALLAERDVVATQPTVSRDLEALGIAKTRGRSSYALPEQQGLAAVLRQFLRGVDASGNLAVVRTPPGAASVVASAIDQSAIPGVLATVQGDDTLLVVAAEGVSGAEVAARLATYARPDTTESWEAQP